MDTKLDYFIQLSDMDINKFNDLHLDYTTKKYFKGLNYIITNEHIDMLNCIEQQDIEGVIRTSHKLLCNRLMEDGKCSGSTESLFKNHIKRDIRYEFNKQYTILCVTLANKIKNKHIIKYLEKHNHKGTCFIEQLIYISSPYPSKLLRNSNKYKNDEEYYILCVKFNYYLCLVDSGRSISELATNWFASIEPEHIQILESIKLGDLEKLKELNKTHRIGCYKDIQLRLAVKYEHINIICYLVNYRYYNIKHAGLSGLMQIIAENGSPNIFDQVINIYKKFILNDDFKEHEPINPQNYTVYDFYQQQNIIDFEYLFKWALYFNNEELLLHIFKNKNIMRLIDSENIIENGKAPYLHDDKDRCTHLLNKIIQNTSIHTF